MTDQRYTDLMDDFKNLKLTEQEIKEGWFFCGGCDGLLTTKKDCCLNQKIDDTITDINF